MKISLLGPPTVELDGARLELKPRKALALLVYLAMAGDGRPRDVLATLLWPESNQSAARAALSRRMSELRGALGAGWLESDRETIGLRDESGDPHTLWLDVAEFRQRLDACQTHDHPASKVCHDSVRPLTEAVALWRGDFLSGFTLRDAPAFDEW